MKNNIHGREDTVLAFLVVADYNLDASGFMKETAISKLGEFQTCTVPESQNT
jgi:hypothetical protein